MIEFACKKCKKVLHSKRNLQQHQGRRVCRETRNPRLREARLKLAKARARELDAARKRKKYVSVYPPCDICTEPERKTIASANCAHTMHTPCFYKHWDSWLNPPPESDYGPLLPLLSPMW